ncbi:MAG: hypothetical protein OSB70_12640 [Myxococcota bacterium]|nr:hypothetical protein [Myxococcota bacterium]
MHDRTVPMGDRFRIEDSAVLLDHAKRGEIRGGDGEQGPGDADLARLAQGLPENFVGMAPPARGRADGIADMPAVAVESRTEAPAKIALPHQRVPLEEEEAAHGNQALGQIAIVLEAVGEIEVLFGVREQEVDFIQSLFSCLIKLPGEFEESRLVGRPVQPLDSE